MIEHAVVARLFLNVEPVTSHFPSSSIYITVWVLATLFSNKQLFAYNLEALCPSSLLLITTTVERYPLLFDTVQSCRFSFELMPMQNTLPIPFLNLFHSRLLSRMAVLYLKTQLYALMLVVLCEFMAPPFELYTLLLVKMQSLSTKLEFLHK